MFKLRLGWYAGVGLDLQAWCQALLQSGCAACTTRLTKQPISQYMSDVHDAYILVILGVDCPGGWRRALGISPAGQLLLGYGIPCAE